MAICELTGKKPVVKNKVSHSNIKTKIKDQPNIQKKRIFSRTLNRMVALNIASSTIRSMEHSGGFDQFVLNAKPAALSPRAAKIRNSIKRKISAQKKSDAVASKLN